MPHFRIAMALVATWLVVAATAQQSSSTPEGPAPCQPQVPTTIAPFDSCKYLPVGPGPVGRGILPPRAVSMVDPKYTDAARKAKINASVIVAVAINEEGGVDDVKVVRPLGYGLDQNAINAARQSKFTPATRDGKPVPVQFSLEMTFRLY